MTWISPLDLKFILVNTLSGSIGVFLFLSLIVIASLAAYFRMSIKVTSSLILIFVLVSTTVIGNIYSIVFVIFAIVSILFLISQPFKG